MVKEYEKDQEDYKKIKELYEASLTEQQKEDIKKLKAEMSAAKEKRKLKAVSHLSIDNSKILVVKKYCNVTCECRQSKICRK